MLQIDLKAWNLQKKTNIPVKDCSVVSISECLLSIISIHMCLRKEFQKTKYELRKQNRDQN